MAFVRRLVPLVASLLALVAVIVVFRALGSGELAAPPWRPSAWGAWMTRTGPLMVVFALLRLLVLTLAWYCLAAVLLGATARSVAAGRVARMGCVLTPTLLRPTLHRALGISLATTLLASPDVAVALPPPVDPPAPAELDADGGQLPAGLEVPARRVPPALRFLANAVRDEAREGNTARPTDGLGDSPSLGERQLPAATHRVRPGDSLWSIARDVLSSARGTAANDAEVADYWREVVEHNRDELADPTNPDLIFPGQDVRLAPLPGTE